MATKLTNRQGGLSMAAAGVFAVVLLGGCSKDLKEENALLTTENQSLRSQLDERNAALDQLHGQLRDKEQGGGQALADGADPFAGIAGVTGTVGAGEVTASVEGDVLFDSGRTQLKPAAKKSLDKVAQVIRDQYAGRTVRVAGHTDKDPIKKSGYKSNYHLAFERAFAVREYLVSKGLPASQVYIASHGPDRAKQTKQDCRRVEIAVIVND